MYYQTRPPVRKPNRGPKFSGYRKPRKELLEKVGKATTLEEFLAKIV